MKKKSEFSQIILFVKPFWGRIIGISLIIVVMSAINQVYPLINRSLIDLISQGYTSFLFLPHPTFTSLILLALFLKVSVTILNRFSAYASSILSIKLRHYLREIGFRHLLKLSIAYYNRTQSGRVMSKLSRGTDGIRSIISNFGINFLPSALSALFSVIVVATINWRIGASVAIVFIPFFFLRRYRFNQVSKIEKKQNRIWDREYGHFWEVIANIRLVKIFAAENLEIHKFFRVVNKLIRNNYRIEEVNNKGVVADLLVDMWTFSIYAYVIYLGLQHQITVGTVFLLISYIEMIKQPLWNLGWIFWEVKYAQIGITDFLKILSEKADITEVEHPLTLDHVRGEVEFKNIWFKYPDKAAHDVFRDISFKIEPGKTLALVGRSGVGKTTIAHLLVRFFDPDRGRITLDGVDLRDLSFGSIHRNIGLVMQESFLYDDTIANNLRYGKPNATEEEMQIACRVANASEFIDKLPKGLETQIGERGIKLSGGQKQRLSIARTVLQNPQVLILDEATSALDSHSELLVQDALWKLIKGRTTIIIAHRLSTVQKADNIVVLDKKKIAEEGSHKELLKLNGLYASLHKIQAGQITTLKEWDLIS